MNAARPMVVANQWFEDHPGGLERYVAAIATESNRRRLPQILLVLGSPSGLAPNFVQYTAGDETSMPFRLASFAVNGIRNRGRANLVVSHFAPYGLAAWLAARPLPLVVHFHGPWSAESAASGDNPLSTVVKNLIERTLYGRAEKVIVLSEAFRDLLVNQYGINPGRIRVIAPGVQMPEMSDLNDAAKRKRQIVCVRRLVDRMGIDTLLHAWARIETKDHRLVIVGDGPKKAEYQALAHKLQISETVEFTGYLDAAELSSIYSESIFSVVPTRQLEGFGLVALESYAHGTPVIGTDCGGLGQFLREHNPEAIVPASHIVALSDALKSGIEETLPLLKNDACLDIAKKHTWDATADVVLETYDEAVRTHAMRPRRSVSRMIKAHLGMRVPRIVNRLRRATLVTRSRGRTKREM